MQHGVPVKCLICLKKHTIAKGGKEREKRQECSVELVTEIGCHCLSSIPFANYLTERLTKVEEKYTQKFSLFKNQKANVILIQNSGMTVKQKKIRCVPNQKDKRTGNEGTQQQKQD